MNVAKPTGLEPLWVRPNEACRLIGIGPTQLYELVAAGTIKSIKVGRKRLISFESLKQLGEQPAAA